MSLRRPINTTSKAVLKLPLPRTKGQLSIEEALKLRKTTRKLSTEQVDLSTVSQLLWALQGITWVEKSREGKKVFHRAAPSAGRTFPLETYVALSNGLFHYEPKKHVLYQLTGKDVRGDLSNAAMTPMNKEAIKTAPLTIVLTADNKKALKASPLLENAARFVHLEAGHAAQNLLLQAGALGLGACTVTSCNVGMIYEALKIPLDHRPIYVIPMGLPEKEK